MAKAAGASKTSQYTSYKTSSRWRANRERKLMQDLKRNPGNAAQIEKALKGIKYRRKKPVTPQWSHTKKRWAQMLKEVSGSCPHKVFNSNTKIADEALQALRVNFPKNLYGDKVSFRLGDRVRWKA